MVQLCLWTKIRTKQWLVLGASAFQCMRAGFLCPKCDNFACLHTRQDQNELHLKRWFFFTKIVIFCKSIYEIFAHILQHYHDFQSNVAIFSSVVQAYAIPYLFGGRIKLIIYQIRDELSVTIHEISISWKKTLDGGPNIITKCTEIHSVSGQIHALRTWLCAWPFTK